MSWEEMPADPRQVKWKKLYTDQYVVAWSIDVKVKGTMLEVRLMIIFREGAVTGRGQWES